MTSPRLLPVLLRTFGCFLFLLFFPLMGAHSETVRHDLRIGLQTGKPEVRLQGNVPLRLESAGAVVVTLPAETALTARPANGGIEISANGIDTPLTASGPVRITPIITTQDEPTADAPSPTPLIRLLGPTRHYDGKQDRPYRGAMELLPRENGLTLINVVEMEEYLWGVVSSEMSPRYPLEALKAQAVAARSYALKNLGRLRSQGFDLDDTAACQVYGGYFSEDPRTTRAVNETARMALTYHGDIIDAVYSSTCGGYTESAEAAWGRAAPYLVSVPDFHGEVETASPRPTNEDAWAAFLKSARALNCLQPEYAKPEAFRWVTLLTRQEIEAALPEQYRVGVIQQIIPMQRGQSGRITSLQLVGSARTVTINKELPIRKAFGNLRSSAFTVDSYRDDRDVPVVFAFWGAGWGHGLGMCQVGAVGLATQGWSYEKILAHYYQGALLEQR